MRAGVIMGIFGSIYEAFKSLFVTTFRRGKTADEEVQKAYEDLKRRLDEKKKNKA